MRSIILYIGFVLLVSGCCPQRVAVESNVLDSVRVETRYVEVIKRDTIKVELPAQSVSRETRDTTSHLETKYAVSDAKIDARGILHHSLETKNVPIRVPVEHKEAKRDSIIYRYKDRVVSEVQLVERKLTEWQKWQMRSFWILLSVLLALLAYRFRKPLMALIRRFILGI